MAGMICSSSTIPEFQHLSSLLRTACMCLELSLYSNSAPDTGVVNVCGKRRARNLTALILNPNARAMLGNSEALNPWWRAQWCSMWGDPRFYAQCFIQSDFNFILCIKICIIISYVLIRYNENIITYLLVLTI